MVVDEEVAKREMELYQEFEIDPNFQIDEEDEDDSENEDNMLKENLDQLGMYQSQEIGGTTGEEIEEVPIVNAQEEEEDEEEEDEEADKQYQEEEQRALEFRLNQMM